ncbi:MAG: hypothetical protein KKD18_06855 [Nanoarchaeota archaeon]|nr:hypothetical protein [Nanoarchaeota archaeon]MBU0978111.1 hypothetical protein [Nanoarchaeota archaeon]
MAEDDEIYFGDIHRRLEMGYWLAALGDPSLLDDERTRDGRHLRDIVSRYDEPIAPEDLPDVTQLDKS